MEATSDTGVPTNKREGKANFSDEELSSLLEEFGENASVLQSKLTNSVTNKRKKQIWEAICAKVNSRGAERRTIAELKKKWAEMKSVSLRIISARRYPKTGGGKKEKEPWFVDLVLDVLGVDTALIEGIVGKYD